MPPRPSNPTIRYRAPSRVPGSKRPWYEGGVGVAGEGEGEGKGEVTVPAAPTAAPQLAQKRPLGGRVSPQLEQEAMRRDNTLDLALDHVYAI